MFVFFSFCSYLQIQQQTLRGPTTETENGFMAGDCTPLVHPLTFGDWRIPIQQPLVLQRPCLEGVYPKPAWWFHFFFNVHPYLGKISYLTNIKIFQLG